MIGDKPFSRGALYLMLRNRTYRGEIVRKDLQGRDIVYTVADPEDAWEAAGTFTDGAFKPERFRTWRE